MTDAPHPQPCILAATDLTLQSAHVAGRGARLARKLGARLVLAHVCPDPDRLPQAARTALMTTANGVEAEALILPGDPDRALADWARANTPVLAVLGLHRERRALDALRLTTLERIVLALPCPALIAHLIPEAPYRAVLALTDFSDSSAQALAMAARVAPHAQFHVLHAERPRLPLIPPLIPRRTRALDPDTAMAQFLHTPGLPTLSEPPLIVQGGVHEVLAMRQAELGADLVGLGVHSGRNPRTLGNYTRDLMRAPPTDLLLGRPQTAEPAQAAGSETAAAG